jgi:hypothetical protein
VTIFLDGSGSRHCGFAVKIREDFQILDSDEAGSHGCSLSGANAIGKRQVVLQIDRVRVSQTGRVAIEFLNISFSPSCQIHTSIYGVRGWMET